MKEGHFSKGGGLFFVETRHALSLQDV